MAEQAQTQLDDCMRLQILRNMVPELKCYLIPTKIVPFLGGILEDSQAQEITDMEEAGKRTDAVQMLMKAVLKKKEEGLNHFVFALRGGEGTPSYDRFLERLDSEAGSCNKNRPANEYYAFIIKLLRGEIVQNLTEGELLGIIEDLEADDALSCTDRQLIEATLTHKTVFHAAVQLFPLMRQYSEDWPYTFFIALEKHKSGFVSKMDPLNENPVVKTEETALAEPEGAVSLSVSKETGREKTDTAQSGQTLPKTVTECLEEMSEQTVAVDACQTERDTAGEASSQGDEVDREAHADDVHSDSDSSFRETGFSDDEKAENESSEKLHEGLRPLSEPKDLRLRKYQEELAAPALRGANVIISAPTGSGKTRVALHIVLKHLEAAAQEQDGRKRKVVFLARTVPLVQQQFKNFEEYLPSSIKPVMVTGEDMNSGNLHMLVPDYDVLVLTPKILENHLTWDKIPSLDVFSLIIFDECHHTRKGEPYNSVMKNYLKSKKAGERLPQIVGLTASIGVEKAATPADARKSILRVMGNLDVKCISVVREHQQELLSKVPRPAEPEAQELMQRQDEISRSIKQIICKIEELQDQSGARMLEPRAGTKALDPELEEIRKMLNKRPGDPKEQKYAQWAVALCKQAKLLSFKSEPKGRREMEQMDKLTAFGREMQVLAEWLVAYSEALDVHDLSCPQDVLHYLRQKFDIQLSCKDKDGFTELERKLFEFFQDLEKKLVKAREGSNPNLQTLGRIIKAHLEEKREEDSRILVFVRTRATCKAVCRWLSSDAVSEKLRELNARTFTGAGAHQSMGGMTLNEQEAVLEKFRSGDVRLLVSTSVGEEGIDIPECNLTIKYNHVGNEVTTVQTRGRSRKEGGKSILLAMPKIIMQERINRRREQYMLAAIEQICHMKEEEISRFVSEVQKETLETDAIDNLVRNSKKHLLKKEKFSLVCGRCRRVKVDGSWIRTINDAHRVIVGHKIDHMVTTHPEEKPKRLGEVELRGSVVCKGCKNHLGQLLYYKKNQFMTVGLKFWTLLDKDDVPSSCKRWKEVHYKIASLNEDDIKEHIEVPATEAAAEEEEEEVQGGAVGGDDI